jgi:hypothetical protein
MGEAALGPGETSREIAEHARHATGAPTTSRHDRVVSILEAALLAVVALLAAWSGYAAAKWSTESRLTVAKASSTRNAANTADLAGLDVRLGDALVFNAWLGVHALGNPADEEVAERRFRPGLKVAFDAWLATEPDTNPDAPPGPQAMPQYKQPDKLHAERLKNEADSLTSEGSEQGQTADDYVRTTVYLASILFLVGISTHFPVRGARYGLLTIAGVILVLSAIQLVTLQKPPT